MAVGIECPVCEAVFQVKQVGRKVGIRCPKCDRKYRFSKEILATQQPADKTTAAKVSSKGSEDSPASEKVKAKKRSAGVKTSAPKKHQPAAAESVADSLESENKTDRWKKKNAAQSPPPLLNPLQTTANRRKPLAKVILRLTNSRPK